METDHRVYACTPEELLEHPYAQFLQAVQTGDVNRLKSLLAQSPLHTHPTKPLPPSLQPLAIEACLHRDVDILELLLEHDDNSLLAEDVERGANLLEIAASIGDAGLCDLLLTRDPNATLLRHTDRSGMTSLHYAALCGRRAACSFLISKGIDVNAVSAQRATPLLFAAGSGHDHCVECLIGSNADLEAADERGFTPLIAAASGGHGAIVGRLVAAGADPTLIESVSRRSALHWAAYAGSLDAVNALLQAYLSSSSPSSRPVALPQYINTQDAEEETALLISARRGSTPVVELLISHNAGVDVCNRAGITPLMAASFFGHAGVVNRLLVSNANVGIIDPVNRRNALHLAALGNNPEVVQVLRQQAGVGVEDRDAGGLTAKELATEADVLALLS